ncbi:sulfite exporter TauE/SafE family protein [Pseudorhodobacter sp.]|uniref:sulfite exporter TauE/SafE family protein n=1 Tax=Pseudorhodobacter sp. TaxID=1934400 RepID=UPI002AFFA2EC|nr:sulfite exporter TauE/SafE family protein [Pseudorhodobacter sp.]
MPDIATLLPMIALLMAIGAFAGVIAGLLGVGGGIILVPAFFYTFSHLGYGGPEVMQVCLATSLSTIIVTSARSVMAHNKKGAVEWGVLRGWWPFIGAGAVAGMLVASSLRSTTLQIIFGVLALTAGLYMAFGKSHWRLGQTMPTGPKRAAIGAGVGFFSVLMGIGGGSFGVPTMSLYNIPIHRAVATAAGFGIIIAVPSVIGFLMVPIANPPPYTLGAVNLPAFALTIAMTVLTAPIGVKLAHTMDPAPLKRIFAVFISLVALNMLRKAAGF